MIAPAQANEFLVLVKDMFKPSPDAEVWEWCEENIELRGTESEVSGRYSSEMTPYVRKVLDFYKRKDLKVMTLMAGTQVLKTIVLMLGGAYWVSHNEGRVIWVMDTEHNARSFSETRWKTLIETSPGTSVLVPRNRDHFKNLEQHLGGTILNFVGSNSPGNLAQRGADLLQLDEEDKFPSRTDAEGDAVTQADQRMKARAGAKKVESSSPTTTHGLIWRGFCQGTMEEWFVDCPKCGEGFVLATGNEDCPVGRLHWDQSARGEDGEWDWDRVKESARMECPHCNHLLDDGEKIDAVAAGDFRVMNPHALPGHVSFHVASHNSPWASCRLGNLAVEFLTFKHRYDLRSWDNYWKGWPSVDELKKPEAAKLRQRREHWEGQPKGAVLFTIGIDTQDDRLELKLIGWGAGMECWIQDYAIFHGDPAYTTVWNELKGFLRDVVKRYRVTAIGLDTGGHRTDAVYQFVRANQKEFPIYALKGSSTTAQPIIGRPGRANRMGVRLYMVGTDTAKERIYSMLLQGDKGPGYCHFRDSLDDQYFEGVASEELKVKWKSGVLKREWVKVEERNEPLDTFVYGLAALHIRGLREVIRMTGQQELELDDESKKSESGGKDTEVEEKKPEASGRRPARRRRVRGPRGMGLNDL